MKKKICVFLWNNFINDARVKREVDSLVEANYDVSVICTYDGDEKVLFQKYNHNNLMIIRVWNFTALKIWAQKKHKGCRLLNGLLDFLEKIRVGKCINIAMVIFNMIRYGLKEKYDFYHCNDLKTLLQGVICSRGFHKAKLIYDAHEVETSRAGGKSKIKYIIEKSLINYPDKMLMTTQTRSEYTANLYHIDKPTVIHNYPIYRTLDRTKNNLYKLLNIAEDEPILLYQGGLQEGRGLENILKAAPYFNRGKVVFIGDGPLKKELIDLVEKYQINNKVHFVDKVPAEELLNYTQHAYLGFQVLENMCFNHYSALSNKLLEYVMADVPVVCSNLPEMQRIVKKEKLGICIESGNVDQLIQAVNLLLEDDKKYSMFKENCKKSKEIYNWNQERYKFVEVYKNLEQLGGLKGDE